MLTSSEKLTMENNIMYLIGLLRDKKPENCCIIDEYLNYCKFMGVTSDDFKEVYNITESPRVIAKFKEMVIKDFITMINDNNTSLGYQAKVGFSDDDKGNIKQIKKYLSGNSEWEKVVGLYIYDTSNTKKIKKTVAYEKLLKS
jgi:hypothetical protein